MKKRITLPLGEDAHYKLKFLAVIRKQTMREIVENYIEEEYKKDPQCQKQTESN